MWKLYNNSRPQDVHPIDAQPSWRLARLLETRLPGWERIFKRRWSATELIAVSGNIADAAFLNVAHMYKHMLGERFPTGVFDWPPTEWLQSYRERKEAVRDSKTHCDEPDRKRQRLLGATGVEEKARAESTVQPSKSADKARAAATGCQPEPANITKTKSARTADAKCAAVRTKPTKVDRGPPATRSTGSSSSSSSSRTNSTMLTIADKWAADATYKL